MNKEDFYNTWNNILHWIRTSQFGQPKSVVALKKKWALCPLVLRHSLSCIAASFFSSPNEPWKQTKRKPQNTREIKKTNMSVEDETNQEKIPDDTKRTRGKKIQRFALDFLLLCRSFSNRRSLFITKSLCKKGERKKKEKEAQHIFFKTNVWFFFPCHSLSLPEPRNLQPRKKKISTTFS